MKRDFTLTTLDGRPKAFTEFADQVLLVVNVASKCGFTPQYAGLEALYRELRSDGFSVLGFPCNQFGGQEPGSAEEIGQFCSTRYDVTFPLFQKIDVKGPQRHPLYTELTQAKDSQGEGGDVKWNFEKFLVDRQGNVQRFLSNVEPDDPDLRAAIARALTRN